jgi:hypothetical protein
MGSTYNAICSSLYRVRGNLGCLVGRLRDAFCKTKSSDEPEKERGGWVMDVRILFQGINGCRLAGNKICWG